MLNNLPWLFILLPLVAAATDRLFLWHRPRAAAAVSVSSAAVCFALCAAYVCGLCTGTPDVYALLDGRGRLLRLGLLTDTLALNMQFAVTGIGLLVHIFSLGYMRTDDSNHSRYFAGLSFFMLSMSCIVLASGLVFMFIGWELVGFSSYLLIGYWFRKSEAADAAKKAFITNRVGDFGFLFGILLVLGIFGTTEFAHLSFGTSGRPAEGLLTVTVLCLFCGAVGKSAQFPLHVWLPDAMEGPTPVSALIHAATMVAAGVYMMVRLQVSLPEGVFTPDACDAIICVGAVTALSAALMACCQDDIKRVLAYSTISQLGYMVMAVGLLAGQAAMFHLFTHAWFKALLFLAAGAIIVRCHHEQNIRRLGGLRRRMPVTTLCFLLGSCALVAVPGFSGFFSKEAILDAAWNECLPAFIVGVLTAALTAFYMVRVCLLTFCGASRSRGASDAQEAGPTMLLPLLILGVAAVIAGFPAVADRLVPYAGFRAHGFEVNEAFYTGLLALFVGGVGGWLVYGSQETGGAAPAAAGGALVRMLRERFYIDQFYDHVLVGGQRWCAIIIRCIDEGVLCRLIGHGAALLIAWVGRILGKLQSGSLRGYAGISAVGLILIIFFLAYTIIH